MDIFHIDLLKKNIVFVKIKNKLKRVRVGLFNRMNKKRFDWRNLNWAKPPNKRKGMTISGKRRLDLTYEIRRWESFLRMTRSGQTGFREAFVRPWPCWYSSASTPGWPRSRCCCSGCCRCHCCCGCCCCYWCCLRPEENSSTNVAVVILPSFRPLISRTREGGTNGLLGFRSI